MVKLYSKESGIIKPIDFNDKNLALNEQIVFSLNCTRATYYFCIIHTVSNNVVQRRLHPITSKDEKKLCITLLNHTHNHHNNRLFTTKKTQSTKRQIQLKESDFLNKTQEACIPHFHKSIQKIDHLQSKYQKESGTHRQSFDDLKIKRYYQYSLKMLLTCLETLDPFQVKDALALHWQQIQNNSLCYTTLSNDPRCMELIELFCEVAIGTAKILNQIKKADAPTSSAIELLMPGLTLESQYPKSFPDLNSAELNATPKKILSVLQTHIIGNQGQCLVPVSLLCNSKNSQATTTDKLQVAGEYPSIDIQTNLEKLINPYFNDDDTKINTTIQLDSDTLFRLKNFSRYHEMLFQIKAEHDALITNDSNTFLGQLKRLIQALHQNSAHRGVGQNDAIALAGYSAIFAFFDYYNKLIGLNPETREIQNKIIHHHIPQQIRSKLEELRNLEILTWCTGSFVEELEPLVNQYESELSSISPDSTTTTTLIIQARESFESNQKKIIEKISTPSGKDKLGLTIDMLELLQIKDHHHIRTMTDIYNLMQFPPNEIELICQLPGKSAEIAQVLGDENEGPDLDNLIDLITTYSDQSVIAFFKANAQVLLGEILNTHYFNYILTVMRDSTRITILENITDFIRPNFVVLTTILGLNELTPKQHAAIIEAIKGDLNIIIQNTHQLIAILNHRKLMFEHKIQILTSLDTKRLEAWKEEARLFFSLKMKQLFNDIKRVAIPRRMNAELLQQTLRDLITEYKAKLFLEPSESGCTCFSFFRSESSLNIKLLAAEEMLHAIAPNDPAENASQNVDEALKQQISYAKTHGRLKVIQNNIITLTNSGHLNHNRHNPLNYSDDRLHRLR